MIETKPWPIPPLEPPVPKGNKLNILWWLQNDEGIETSYHPDWPQWRREIFWWFRNPAFNFFRFVVGVEDRHLIVTGPIPVFDPVWEDSGKTGLKWSIIRTGWLILPFISYSGTRWLWYAGWLPSGGRLGIKINYHRCIMRVIDIVRKIAPKARQEYLAAFDHGDSLLSQAGITTPQRVSHFLAQIMHESGALTITQENMSYRAPRIMEIFGVGHHSAQVTQREASFLAGKPYDLAERVYGIGNHKKAMEFDNLKAGDGFTYRGGGILQTTGKSNYRRMGFKCNVDFEHRPELIFSGEHALKPAVAEWTEGGCNKFADDDKINVITKIINGGLNGLHERQVWYNQIRPMMPLTLTFDTSILPPLPPPPDIEPIKPKPPANNTAPTITASSSLLASIVFALQSDTVMRAAAIVAGGVVIAVAVYVLHKHLQQKG